MKNILWIFGFLLLLTSCGSEDDICLGEESTPRLKLQFRNANNQIVALDTLYVDVDYGKDSLKQIVTAAVRQDSVMVPMRIDNSPYTDIYIKQRLVGPRSKIRITYDQKAIYVSPACGFKVNYENLKGEVQESNPVQSIQPNVTTLTDENSINFYLRF